ncbi:uncharacterized protein ACRADG_002042 [Cochliomyia hominivorax]
MTFMSKFIIVALALVACVMADVSELGYNYPAPEHHEEVASLPQAPENNYLPPAPPAPEPQNTYIPPPAPAPVAPQNTYIPPAAPAPAPVESAELAQDGYRYKTVRRRVKFIIVALALVACVMADVSELGYNYPAPEHHEEVASLPQAPENNYLPPAPPAPEPQNTYIPPPAPAPVVPQNTYIPPAAPAPAPVESAELAQDGYRYKTVRRRVVRRRY